MPVIRLTTVENMGGRLVASYATCLDPLAVPGLGRKRDMMRETATQMWERDPRLAARMTQAQAEAWIAARSASMRSPRHCYTIVNDADLAALVMGAMP